MSVERLTGRVKWFNNKNGYGFISTCADDSKDIFVHYSGIRGYTPPTEKRENYQFKYLVQGEYVEFDLVKMEDDEKHEFKANDISGVLGGPLMCETISENSKSRGPPRGRPRRGEQPN